MRDDERVDFDQERAGKQHRAHVHHRRKQEHGEKQRMSAGAWHRGAECHGGAFPGRRRGCHGVHWLLEEHLQVTTDALDAQMQVADAFERGDQQQKRDHGGNRIGHQGENCDERERPQRDADQKERHPRLTSGANGCSERLEFALRVIRHKEFFTQCLISRPKPLFL